MVREGFWDDIEMLELDSDGLLIYIALWQVADDSGCIDYRPRIIKGLAFAEREAMTPEIIGHWMEVLTGMGKLVRYDTDAKPCAYLKNFAKHQSPPNPGKPSVPLPPWIAWAPSGNRHRGGDFLLDLSVMEAHLTALSQPCDRPVTEAPSTSTSPDPDPVPGPEENKVPERVVPGEKKTKKRTDVKTEPPVDFAQFWEAYPRKEGKSDALRHWNGRIEEVVKADRAVLIEQITRGAINYASHLRAEGTELRYIKLASTFLSKVGRHWEEWQEPRQGGNSGNGPTHTPTGGGHGGNSGGRGPNQALPSAAPVSAEDLLELQRRAGVGGDRAAD